MILKSKTTSFYNNLNKGKVKRGILGIDQRFNVNKILKKKNIYENFVDEISPYLNKNKLVLDLGCGPGAFSIAISDKCREVYAIDIIDDFVKAAKKNAKIYKKNNILTKLQKKNKIPIDDNFFDVVFLVDVLHHVENVNAFLLDIKRVLKKNGLIIIFEPNKLNPLMYLIHLFDYNERGLLELGRPGIYRKKLENYFEILNIKFSGLVIGPENYIFELIVRFLKTKLIYFLLGWLMPKISIIGQNSGK